MQLQGWHEGVEIGVEVAVGLPPPGQRGEGAVGEYGGVRRPVGTGQARRAADEAAEDGVLRVDTGDADPPDLPGECVASGSALHELVQDVIARSGGVEGRDRGGGTDEAALAVQVGLDESGCGDRLGLVDQPGHELDARGRRHRTAAPGEVVGKIDVQRRRRLLDRNGLRATQRGEIRGKTDFGRAVNPLRFARGSSADRQHDRRLAQARVATAPQKGIRARNRGRVMPRSHAVLPIGTTSTQQGGAPLRAGYSTAAAASSDLPIRPAPAVRVIHEYARLMRDRRDVIGRSSLRRCRPPSSGCGPPPPVAGRRPRGGTPRPSPGPWATSSRAAAASPRRVGRSSCPRGRPRSR